MSAQRPLSKRELAVARAAAARSKDYAAEIAQTYADTWRENGEDRVAKAIEGIVEYIRSADFEWQATRS